MGTASFEAWETSREQWLRNSAPLEEEGAASSRETATLCFIAAVIAIAIGAIGVAAFAASVEFAVTTAVVVSWGREGFCFALLCFCFHCSGCFAFQTSSNGAGYSKPDSAGSSCSYWEGLKQG